MKHSYEILSAFQALALESEPFQHHLIDRLEEAFEYRLRQNRNGLLRVAEKRQAPVSLYRDIHKMIWRHVFTIDRGRTYRLREIAQPEDWELKTKKFKTVAGSCGSDMVQRELLPLERTNPNSQPSRYRFKWPVGLCYINPQHPVVQTLLQQYIEEQRAIDARIVTIDLATHQIITTLDSAGETPSCLR